MHVIVNFDKKKKKKQTDNYILNMKIYTSHLKYIKRSINDGFFWALIHRILYTKDFLINKKNIRNFNTTIILIQIFIRILVNGVH